MAGFELPRLGTVADAAHDLRIGRYLPLYIAGIAAGVAIGLGVSLYSDARVQVETYESPAPAPVAVNVTDSNTSNALPITTSGSESDVALNVEVQLPDGFYRFFQAPPVPVAPVVPVAPALPGDSAPAEAPQAAAPVLHTSPQPQQPAVPQAQPVAADAPAAPAADARPNFYVPPVSGAGPSDLEQRLFNGMNADRANAGLPAYSYDAGLTRIARTRSQQMVDQDYFSHVDPFGYAMYTELLAYFAYTSYAWAGENLALNNYASSEAAERALISLMNSPTHRANILAGDFFRVGIGEADTADGRHIFTMIFLG